MKTISFTEFRKHASSVFSAVEKGDIFVILRHGKPVAEIKPMVPKDAIPSWKRAGIRLSVKGTKLSSAILEERELEDVL
jgi:antitoxin (DNA-binding transcriptional repressor) of toxin-antitoxin stability system